jgi:hypothetical protein
LANLTPAFSANNISSGDVGDWGVWATQNNKGLFEKNLVDDINSFQQKFSENISDPDFVPIDAKLGNAFISGLSELNSIMEISLIPFIRIFLIVLFIFWVFFETYQMMTSEQDIKKLAQEIIKKLILISVWIWVIDFGPAKLFMMVIDPVLQMGSYMSDLILNSVSNTAGYPLSNSCAAIHNYLAESAPATTIISTDGVANILCVPTTLSNFLYTAVSAGWQWMLNGIGTSMFSFTVGLTFVVLFIYNIYKFILMTLSVVVDLFLGMIMLPFTALAECFGKSQTSYKGYGGEIFNKFMELFQNTESLEAQFKRIINAVIYFISLSIVIAICAAILSGVINIDMANNIPTIENNDFLSALIAGALVAYLATQADTLAKKIGGAVNDSFGKDMNKDLGDLRKSAVNIIKQLKKSE